jgi:hypothetical protein
MRHSPLLLLFAFAALLLPARMTAQPLIFAHPTSTSAFVGDSSATFAVLATGSPSPSYQWQISTDSGSTWNNLSGNATYANVTTASLTINSPGLSLNGYKYRCTVTSASVPTNSFGAKLKVYAAPTVTPVLTVTPSTIASNSTANITLHITGLNSGDSVRIRRYLDLNGNGSADIGEPDVQDILVTDGQAVAFGNVTDPNIPGDDDGTANGSITTHLTLPTSPEVGQLAGKYIIVVASPSGEFKPVTQPLTITQPAYGQSISGQITSGGSPLPNSGLALLTLDSYGDTLFATGTVSDAGGNFTISAPSGASYYLLPVHLGNVASFQNASPVSLGAGQTITGQNLSMVAATNTISGNVSSNGNGVPSLQMFIQSSSSSISLSYSDKDGNFAVGVTPDQWKFELSDLSLGLLQYLKPNSKPTVDTTGGNQNLYMTLTQANAMIYGTVTNNLSNPLANVSLDGNDSGSFNPNTVTNTSGNYYMLAHGPGSGSDSWFIQPDSSASGLSGYIIPPGQSVNLTSGQAQQVNFTVSPVTAHLQGYVTQNGTPVSGVTVGASPSNTSSSTWISAVTDANGYFDIGVYGGTWTITLDNGSASSNNLVGPNLTETVADGQTLSGIAFQVKPGTGIISGTVVDLNSSPMAFTNVFAYATINGVLYNAGSQTDSNGNYSFPVINGTWTVNVGPSGFAQQTVTVTGASQTANFAETVITGQPQNQTVTVGQSTVFSVQTSAPGTVSFQWQVSTNGGSAWSNTSDNTIYVGSTSSVLNVNSIPIGLNGYQYRCIAGYNTTLTYSSPATLTVLTLFQQWQSTEFGSNAGNPSIAGPLADPDHDGLPNLIEYALGSNPLIATGSSFRPVAAIAVNPTDQLLHLTLTANLNANATDVTVTAEVSADLVTWNSGATYVDTVSDTTNNGIRTLVLRDHTPLTAGTRRFIRLRVTGS